MAKKKKPRLAPLPILRAGTYTAEQVLRHVADLIEEEPKRLRMRSWCAMFKGVKLLHLAKIAKPAACGTAACAAGWINISTRHSINGWDGISGQSALFVLFGSSYYELTGANDELSQLFAETEWGSRRVVNRLRKICTTYAADLQHPVVVPPARRS